MRSTSPRITWTPTFGFPTKRQILGQVFCNGAYKLFHSKLQRKHQWALEDLVPHKIEIFTWFALLDKLNTKSRLISMRLIPPSDYLCILYNLFPEDGDHLLLHCGFSWKLWCWWLNIWKLSWVIPSSLISLFSQWLPPSRGNFRKKLWTADFIIISWTIWKERNERIFPNNFSSLPQLQELVLLRMSWWIKG